MNPLVTKHCIEFDSDGSWTWKLNFLNLSTLTLDFQLARQFSWFSGAQCSRTDLNKKFTTAWKLIPKKSKISILEIHHIGSHCIDFFKKHILLCNTKRGLQWLHSNSMYFVKKLPMWWIFDLANMKPIGYRLSCCGSLWSR